MVSTLKPGEPERRGRVVKTIRGFALLAVVYVIAGNLLHRVVFPQPPPDPATFPKLGDRFASTAEGMSSEVIAVDGQWLGLRSTLAPGAAGPPPHRHRSFEENFVVERGEVHLEVDGEVRTLAPGDAVRVPAGTQHRPFNPTAEPAVLTSDRTMPRVFAACLVQLYPALDAGPMATLLQLAVLDPSCDTHVMPGAAEAGVRWLLGPAARLAGYRAYDERKAQRAAALSR